MDKKRLNENDSQSDYIHSFDSQIKMANFLFIEKFAQRRARTIHFIWNKSISFFFYFWNIEIGFFSNSENLFAFHIFSLHVHNSRLQFLLTVINCSYFTFLDTGQGSWPILCFCNQMNYMNFQSKSWLSFAFQEFFIIVWGIWSLIVTMRLQSSDLPIAFPVSDQDLNSNSNSQQAHHC